MKSMLGLSGKLLLWNLARSRGRTLIMIVTVFCALSSYVLLGTALSEMADSVVQAMRPGWPFDVTVEGRVGQDEISSVQAMEGVRHVETARSATVFLGPTLQEVLSVPLTGTAFVLELDSGRLPTEVNEVAVPALLADAFKLSVGGRVRLVGQRQGAIAQEYEVVGVLSGKAGVLAIPLLTQEGIALIRDGENYLNRMLIQLDGNVNLDTFSKKLGTLVTATIKLEAEGYETVQQSRSLSESLVLMLRSLILMITAASLGVLFYLSLRSGAYQTGVLRAMGVQRIWLLLPALAVTLFIFVLAVPITALLLPVVAARIGLHADQAVLLRTLTRDVGTYVIVGLLSTLVINWRFLSMPVPKLLKDSW